MYKGIINFDLSSISPKNSYHYFKEHFFNLKNIKENPKVNILHKLKINKNLFSIILFFTVIIFYLFSFEIALIFVISSFFTFFLFVYMPVIKHKKKYADINKELPFALRHIGTQLKSGRGLHDTLITISKGDYGSLSSEFKRVLEEIRYGKTTEEALRDMSKRINSEGLDRAIQQIIGTLKVGGNLANNLNIIADDISFDMQVKLKEYSQKLNGFILIYSFIAILAPVISLIMLMAASTVMGNIFPKELILLIYIFFFPLIVVFMGLFIKKLEPTV